MLLLVKPILPLIPFVTRDVYTDRITRLYTLTPNP